MNKVSIPWRELGIVEAKPEGEKVRKRFLSFGNHVIKGTKNPKLLASFPEDTLFIHQISKDELGGHGQIAVFYTIIPQDCAQDLWEEEKRKFSQIFSQKVVDFKRRYEGMSFNAMVSKEVIWERVNQAHKACHWGVTILGAGPAVCEEKDPFDMK